MEVVIYMLGVCLGAILVVVGYFYVIYKLVMRNFK